MKNIIFYTILFFLIWHCSINQVFAFIDKGDFDEIKRQLNEEDFQTKIQAMRKIQKSGLSLEDVSQLLETAVSSDDIRIQLFAFRILYEHGDKSIIDQLFSYLSDPLVGQNTKLRIIYFIKGLKDESIIYRLKPLIFDEQDDIVRIGMLNVFFSITPLESAEEKLVQIIKTYLKEGSRENKLKILDFISGQRENAIPLLKIAFDDEDMLVKEKAFDTISHMDTVDVSKIIGPYVKKKDKVSVYNAAFILGMRGEKSYFRFITNDLQSKDKAVRGGAIDFLFRRLGKGGEEAFLKIIKRISEGDEDEEIREKAAQYIKYWNQIGRSSLPLNRQKE